MNTCHSCKLQKKDQDSYSSPTAESLRRTLGAIALRLKFVLLLV